MQKKVLKFLLVFLAAIAIFLLAAAAIKYTYHRNFLSHCHRVCYYNKIEAIWEYRPWGYNTDYNQEDRDFPSLETCLAYCLSQKQIDFIK